MTTTYKPSELGTADSNKVKCPECGAESPVKHARYVSDIEIICVTDCCSHVLHLEVPENIKKLIYLDQWFVSELFAKKVDADRKEIFERILQKIIGLQQCEKIAVVVSYLNYTETAAMEYPDHRDPTWQLFSQLSVETLTRPQLDTVISQHVRSIVNPENELHWSDILEKSPHRFCIPSIVMLTREPLKKILQMENFESTIFNESAREIIDNQLSQLPTDAGLDTCHELMTKLTTSDLIEGCKFGKNPQHGGGYQMYYGHVLPLVKALNIAGLSDDEAVDAIVNRGNPQLPISTLLFIALESLNLHKAQVAIKKSGALTQKEKKFSRSYGESRTNDYSHISTYAPYVDFILTDNGVANLLNGNQLKPLGVELACQVFSDQNISELESELSNLAAQEESEENLILRRLLSGFSEQEQRDKLSQELKERIMQNVRAMGYEI